MDVRFEETTERVAIKTALEGPRAWFILDLVNGGWYTNGVKEEVESWQNMVPDPTWEGGAS